MSVDTERPEGSRTAEGLLERTGEITEIDRTVERLMAGRAGLVVIEGGAGSGRTALLDRVVAAGRSVGVPILPASGSLSERDVAFGLSGQLFGMAPPSLRALTASPWPLGMLDGVFTTMYRRITELAGAGPVIIAVDDLHLFDDLSLRWLAYLSHRLAALPALLAVTVCTGGVQSHSGTALTAELRNRLDAVTLRPAPLSADAVRTVLDGYAHDPVPDWFAASCATLTAGNPLLLNELMRTLAQENIDPDRMDPDTLAKIAPPGVAQYVLGRISHLSPTAAKVAHALAVLGSTLRSDVVASMCSMEESAVRDLLLALNQLGIVRSVPPAGFAHPLVRNALYSDLRTGERQRFHHAAATLLYAQDAPPEEVARHLLATSPTLDPRTVEMLCRIAVDLLAAGERTMATECLRRAMRGSISPTHRGNLALTLGAALAGHDPRGAITHLKHAISVVKQPRQVSRAHLVLGRVLACSGKVLEAVEVLGIGADHLDDERPDLAAQARETRLVLSLLHGRTVGAANAALDTDATDEFPVAAAVRATWSGIDRDATVRRLQQVLEDAELATTRPLEHTAALLSLVHAERVDLATRYLDRATADNTACTAELATVRATIALADGEVRAAAGHARRAAELVESGAARPLLLDHRAVLISALGELGEQAEVATLIGGTGLIRDLPDDWRFNHLLEARGRLRVLSGEVHAGLADLTECGRRLAHWDVDNPAVNDWRSTAAVALARAGDRDRARVLADEQVGAARRWGAPRALGRSLRARGLVEEDPATRTRWLDEAVSALRGSPAVLDLARALVDLGSAMISRKNPRPARELLREGLAIAQRCGALALATHAHDELLRSGARPRRRAESGRDALTSAELRTALMAAEGHTNRQIAQELYVTQRTIELHLTNTYRKLQVRNRAELSAVLNDGVTVGR